MNLVDLHSPCPDGLYDPHWIDDAHLHPERDLHCPGGRSATIEDLDGKEVLYCKVHNLLVRWVTASNCAAGAYTVDCDIVDMVLIPIPSGVTAEEK